jgi:hypothetical protein
MCGRERGLAEASMRNPEESTAITMGDQDEQPVLPPAPCWNCGALMTDLAIHPLGGPWICLPCKNETLEAARARYAPTPAPEPVVTTETAEDAEAAEITANDDVPF